MLKNYIKAAFRNLWRNKAFSAINIIGLAVGIATCLLILLFVKHEWSYDRFNEKAGQIVRVVFKGSVQGEMMKEANVMPPVAQSLQKDYPEVLAATRIRNYGRQRIAIGDQSFKQDEFAYVDSNFFSIFTLSFVSGNPKTALIEPNSIVISETVAARYFKNENPVGKSIDFTGLHAIYTVKGVIKNIPDNSHFHFDILGSMATLPEAREQSWMNSNFFTYLLLQKGYDYKKLEAKLPGVVEKYLGPQLQQASGISFETFRKAGNNLGLFLEPLTDIHLKSDVLFDLSEGGDLRYVYIFSAIALFMLLIACINFMNLSTAGAGKRSKEVGIRKVLGSRKHQLIWQFLVESIVLSFISLSLALLLVKLALPVFNTLAAKNLSFTLIDSPVSILLLVVFAIVVGTLAGSYPAFFLSSFNTISVLKSKFTSGKQSIGLRSALVVFQFFISITLIVCTIVVYNQLNYINSKDIGYNKEQVLLIGETYLLGKNEALLHNQLKKDARVENVSTSSFLPAGPSNSNNFIVYPDFKETQLVKTLRYHVDPQYIPTLGMQMVAGRNFSETLASDSNAIILNETGAKAFGFKNDALEHKVTYSMNGGRKQSYTVIGIVKDFHFKSLHQPISPLVMTLGDNTGSIIARINSKDVSGLLSSVKKQWSSITMEEPFVYSFLDERFRQTYEKEQKMGLILTIFAGLTIMVGCLGLFGLAAFTAEQRTKEIGIRKVLGASVSGVVTMLTKDFLKLVAIAFVIACPIAWFIMSKWLQDFAYRVTIQWWVFLIAAIAAIFITLVSVSLKAVKAAIANPVKSLRSE